jgi:hypothetical protein
MTITTADVSTTNRSSGGGGQWVTSHAAMTSATTAMPAEIATMRTIVSWSGPG